MQNPFKGLTNEILELDIRELQVKLNKDGKYMAPEMIRAHQTVIRAIEKELERRKTCLVVH